MIIKVCGLTHVSEAKYLNENKIDFAGFVLFFEKSKRNVSLDTAKMIMNELMPSIKKVAVVVSPSIEEIRAIEKARFDYIQIHGEINESLLQQINLPVLKAFNVNDMEQFSIFQNNSKIAGYVFDAAIPGSGSSFDWSLLKNIPRDNKLLILAGGLNCGNVANAISEVKPDGVDVSSGVEYDSVPGKDPKKIQDFAASVRCVTITERG